MTVKELIDKLQQFDEDKEANDKGYRIGNHSFEEDGYEVTKAEDKIWEGLGFVLQWAKYGLKK